MANDAMADETGHIDFLVKHYPGGKQSTHLHSMKAGDSITFLRIPGYSWQPNEQAHIGLIAGGQGITPCYQLARGILKNPEERTRVTLVWGVNSDADIVLGSELAELEQQHPGQFKVVYTVAKPSPGSKQAKGFITKELLESAGVAPGEKGAGKVFVCGPPPMEKALTGKGGVLPEMDTRRPRSISSRAGLGFRIGVEGGRVWTLNFLLGLVRSLRDSAIGFEQTPMHTLRTHPVWVRLTNVKRSGGRLQT